MPPEPLMHTTKGLFDGRFGRRNSARGVPGVGDVQDLCQIGILGHIGNRVGGAEVLGRQRDVPHDIGPRCGWTEGLAVNQEINRTRIARPQQRRVFQGWDRIALTSIEDLFEQDRAIYA